VKAAQLPYSTQNYSLAYRAKGDRFRTMFRYSSSTAYYFLEFKNGHTAELWKYPNASTSVQVGAAVDLSMALPGFSLGDWHDYTLAVEGNTSKLSIDGTAVATFTDSTLTAGGIGFALKGTGAAVTVNIDNVVVKPIG